MITSRERVLAALDHQETDRVPIDLGSSRSTGINAIAYQKLKQFLGESSDTVLFDVKQLLALPDLEILRRLGSDVVILPRLAPSLGIPINEYKRGCLPCNGGECLLPKAFEPIDLPDGGLGVVNGQGRLIAKRPKGGLYFDEVYAPLAECESEDEIDALPMPSISDSEMIFQREQAKKLYEATDFAISGATSFSLFEKGLKDWGYENFLIMMMTEPELVEHYLDRLTDAYIVMMERYLEAVGDYVQIVQTNDDLGQQRGMLISPETYRQMFKPRHARIVQAIKRKNKQMHIYLHCCGSIFPVIGDLAEVGFDILNPIQKECDNMDPSEIKQQFGKQLTFWGGGCSTQTTLTHGSVEDVVEEVKNMLSIFAPGGGYVFSQIHNIQAGISPEKILALFDTALRYGRAPYGKEC
jgi:uroporphyrinogen decarboxylase